MRNKNFKKNTKIYFNNSCSICRFEINHYKKLNNVIDWVDVTQNKVAEKETSKEPSQLIRRLHAKHDGKILEGKFENGNLVESYKLSGSTNTIPTNMNSSNDSTFQKPNLQNLENEVKGMFKNMFN